MPIISVHWNTVCHLQQAKASAEITEATQNMRLQADQVTKAMREQARTSHEMSMAVANVSKDALRVTNANRNHLDAAHKILVEVSELRQITNRNADGVKATLTTTSGLADRARELGEIMDGMIGANGTEKTKRRRTKKPAADERG